MCHCLHHLTNRCKNSEYDQEIPQSQNCRQTCGTVRKSHTTITRHQEDKLSKATSSVFPIKMIAKLEGTQSNAQQNRTNAESHNGRNNHHFVASKYRFNENDKYANTQKYNYNTNHSIIQFFQQTNKKTSLTGKIQHNIIYSELFTKLIQMCRTDTLHSLALS